MATTKTVGATLTTSIKTARTGTIMGSIIGTNPTGADLASSSTDRRTTSASYGSTQW